MEDNQEELENGEDNESKEKPMSDWLRKFLKLNEGKVPYSTLRHEKNDEFLRFASPNFGRMRARQDAVRKVMGIK